MNFRRVVAQFFFNDRSVATMNGFPWIQWFPRDWTADTRALSPAAKGAWMDILCFLHNCSTRGKATMSVESWARVIGAGGDETGRLIDELRRSGVADVVTLGNTDVMVSNRRMLREEHAREKNRERVRRHRQKNDLQSDSTGINGHGDFFGNEGATIQKPEARSHNTEIRRAERSAPTAQDLVKKYEANPAYQGIDVAREFAKMQAWSQANQKQPTERRFVNWLNRVERPVGGSGRPSGPKIPSLNDFMTEKQA